MNKSELITKVANVTGYTKKETEIITDALLNIITDSLVSGEKVLLTNFGSFEVKERASRTGRNPKTGESVEIAPSKSTTFHPCSALKDAIDN